MPGEPTGRAGEFLIYLVDDEEILLNLAEVALLRDGYTLRKFCDPQAALDAFGRETPKPSLLLTDFAMTPMNGLELSARCKSTHPTLKILLVSGTAGPELMTNCSTTIDGFLQKPYEPAELARRVRSMLRP
jgi:CheY-like chemotaxis protein